MTVRGDVAERPDAADGAGSGDHCRMADEQPGDDVPCRTAPPCCLVEGGPGHLGADGRDDCRPHSQQPVQLDPKHWRSTWRQGAAAGRLASGPTEGVGAGAVAQQQGHDCPH